MELLKRLKSNHISVPTAYEMKLDKKTGVWIGTVNKNNVKKGKQITKK